MSETAIQIESSFPIPRLENETSKAYEAFQAFCLMGSDRSIDAAYEKTTGKQMGNRTSNHWDKWSCKYNWVQRSIEYDNWLAKSDIKIIREERDESIAILHKRSRETFEQADKTGLMLLKAIAIGIEDRLKQKDKHGKIKALEATEARNWATAYQAACSGNKITNEIFQNILGLDTIAKIVEKDSTN